MEMLILLLLIALGVIIYKLIRINDKIDQIDYQLFSVKLLIDGAMRQRDKKSEEVEMAPVAATPERSPEDYDRNIEPEVAVDYVPAINQSEQEEIELTQPSYISEAVDKEEIATVKRRLNIEKLVGENLFSKIGILALIIGIGFFVKFAIDNNWINQTYMTILGIVTGFGLWGIAYKLRDSYRGFSSVLAGGGFAICFVSIAIAYNIYKLIPSWLTFASLVFLTAVMILIAVKFDRRQLAMVAIIGGYIAPFMSASDSGSAIMLFAYTTILNAAMLVVCVKKNWWVLSVPGCLITWLIVLISPIRSGQYIAGYVFCTVFLVMFSLPMALTMWRDIKSPKLFYGLVAASIINMFAYTGLALGYIDRIEWLNNFRGIVPLVVAGLNMVIYLKNYRMQNFSLMHNLLLGSVIVFIFLSVMTQFSDPNIMTVFFAVFVMGLLEIYGRTSKRIFFISGFVLSVITFVIINAELSTNLYAPTIGCFTTMLVCGLCYFSYSIILSRNVSVYRNLLTDVYEPIIAVVCYVATYIEGNAIYILIKALHEPEASLQAAALMIMTCLLFMSIYFNRNAVNRLTIPGVAIVVFVIFNYIPDPSNLMSEIFQWLSACLFICVLAVQVKSALTGIHSVEDGRRNNYVAYYSIVGSIFLIAITELMLRTASLTEYYSAGFSIALIINGAVLLTLGMKYKCITVRFIGLVMFGLLLLKLVVYDLWLLPMIGRIIVFILLGAVLLILSFMYQRLRSKLFDKD